MTPAQLRIAASARDMLAQAAPGDLEGAWWEVGTDQASDVADLPDAAVDRKGGLAIIVSFHGLPIRWVEGDQLRLMRPVNALDQVPVAFAWTCPRRGRMMVMGDHASEPVPLREALSLLPRPTIGEARRIFGRAFGQGLRDAVRAMG
jgi:hypothetical protein